MCGIAGIYSNNKSITKSDLIKMSDILVHRGPDGFGIWCDEENTIGFMHRRLAIIDLSEMANQPMHYMNRYTITFNGEVYNYIELKQELIKEGYQFLTNSDTEVLLALFDFWGYDCLKRIDGMFAFAIWDNLKKELFLARDRFGEKPLYYSQSNNQFQFASEMKALFAIGVSKNISPETIYEYLQHKILVNENDPVKTFYKDIKQLDAASYMIVKNGVILKKINYWNLNNIPINTTISIEEAAFNFRNILTTSIIRRMRSDVPIGSSLSGGIDSSSIVMISNSLKQKNQNQNVFSARFKNFEKDEGEYIDLINKRAKNINAYTVWPNIENLNDELNKLAYYQEEPFTSGSIYNQFCVMRLAKEHGTTVLLDGQGADEQLAGYLHYYQHYLTSLITKKPFDFLNEKQKYNSIHKNLQPYRIPRRLPFWIAKKIILGQKYRYDEDIRNILIRDTTGPGLKTLLRYGDRNSMAFSREVRLPFLSHELSEFIFSLPTNYILHNGWTKYVLRKAVEGIIPDEITWRKDKIGFEPPQDIWIKKLLPLYSNIKKSTNLMDYTNGKKVDKVSNWEWLMFKTYIIDGI